MSIYYKKPDNTWTELANNMPESRYTKVECEDKFVKKPTLQKLAAICPCSESGLPTYDNSHWITDTLYFVDLAFVYKMPSSRTTAREHTIVIYDGIKFDCGSINISTDPAWPASTFAAPVISTSTKSVIQIYFDKYELTYSGYTVYLTGVCHKTA